MSDPGEFRLASLPRRRASQAVVAALLFGLHGAGRTAAISLVTPDEAIRDLDAPQPPMTRAMPDPLAPRIELESPEAGRKLTSPIDVRLRWAASEGAAIDPTTFRLLYGRLELDVTARILKAAQVSAAGVVATGAALPTGAHRFSVEVADTQGRVGRRSFSVTVV